MSLTDELKIRFPPGCMSRLKKAVMLESLKTATWARKVLLEAAAQRLAKQRSKD